jgi:peptide chain release factor
MDWNFPVRPAKIEALKKRFEELAIREADCEENFVRGSGKGGQKVNKTNNCVQLRHRPTGLLVQCHRERERSLNRYLARVALADAIERETNGGQTEAEKKAHDKIRKQKSRRQRRSSSGGMEAESRDP